MLSWEYPPKVIGGLARAVADLSQALVKAGHEVAVVTGDWQECQTLEDVDGVQVHRTNQFLPKAPDFTDEVQLMNYNLIQKGITLLSRGDCDLIHAHDWLVAPSAKVLKHAFQKPLIATIHATEWGRNNGLHTPMQRQISDLEWWLTYEAYGVICCSEYMRGELQAIFQVPPDKLSVIPNGVRSAEFSRTHDDLDQWRSRWALPEEDIVLYVGRHVFEKGIDLLLEAAPRIMERRPMTKLIIAGTGPRRAELMDKAGQLGLGSKVFFPGFVDDLTRNSLYRLADVAVFPSLYEPFGIVALEAMAGGAAVIVSDVGGFKETVRHEFNGLTFFSGNPDSLAHNILRLLEDKPFAQKLKEQAANDVVKNYNWEQIAQKTVDFYGVYHPLTQAAGPSYDRYRIASKLPEKGVSVHESSNHGRR